ncbi:uncharacterized protein LOC143864873 isoform X5 [Tasmannia lanceolata]|uniref:uncharacterized protein LOC143864873 isoform X5 n=1 Tax=Tasmannia lanceolata TaxID=3420 RepID=UPI0040636C42
MDSHFNNRNRYAPFHNHNFKNPTTYIPSNPYHPNPNRLQSAFPSSHFQDRSKIDHHQYQEHEIRNNYLYPSTNLIRKPSSSTSHSDHNIEKEVVRLWNQSQYDHHHQYQEHKLRNNYHHQELNLYPSTNFIRMPSSSASIFPHPGHKIDNEVVSDESGFRIVSDHHYYQEHELRNNYYYHQPNQSTNLIRKPSSSASIFPHFDQKMKKEVVSYESRLRIVSEIPHNDHQQQKLPSNYHHHHGHKMENNVFSDGKWFPPIKKEGNESDHEILRTPKNNKLQKTSVFARLQPLKPTRKIKDEQLVSSSSCFVESNATPLKGNDSLLFSQNEMPMELEVSFKSNALVARLVTGIQEGHVLDVVSSSQKELKESPDVTGMQEGHVIDTTSSSQKELKENTDDINPTKKKKKKRKRRNIVIPVSGLDSSQVTGIQEGHFIDLASSSQKELVENTDEIVSTKKKMKKRKRRNTILHVSDVDSLQVGGIQEGHVLDATSSSRKELVQNPDATGIQERHVIDVTSSSEKKSKENPDETSPTKKRKVTGIQEGHVLDATLSSQKKLKEKPVVTGMQEWYVIDLTSSSEKELKKNLDETGPTKKKKKKKRKKSNIILPVSDLDGLQEGHVLDRTSSSQKELEEDPDVTVIQEGHVIDATSSSLMELKENPGETSPTKKKSKKKKRKTSNIILPVSDLDSLQVTGILEGHVIDAISSSQKELKENPDETGPTTMKKKMKKRKRSNVILPVSDIDSLQVTGILEGHVIDATTSSQKELKENPDKTDSTKKKKMMKMKKRKMSNIILPVSDLDSFQVTGIQEGHVIDATSSFQKELKELEFIDLPKVTSPDTSAVDGSRACPNQMLVSLKESSVETSDVVMASIVDGINENPRKDGVIFVKDVSQYVHPDLDYTKDLVVLDMQPPLPLALEGDHPEAAPIGTVVSNTNSNKEEHSPERLPMIDAPNSISVVSELHILNAEQSSCHLSVEKVCGDSNKPDEKPMNIDVIPLNSIDSSVSEPEVIEKSDQRMINVRAIPKKTQLTLQKNELSTANSILTGGELVGRRIHQSPGIPRSFPHRAIFTSGPSKELTFSTNNARAQTWRRTAIASPSPLPIHDSPLSSGTPKRQSPKKIGKLQSASYIHRGNSLVRKSGLSRSVYPSNFMTGNEIKNSMGTESKVDSAERLACSKDGGMNPLFDRPETPPRPLTDRLPNSTVDCPYSIIAEPLSQDASETFADATSGPIKLIKGEYAPGNIKPSENPPADLLVRNLEIQSLLGGRKSKSSNQLVAAPTPEPRDLAVSITGKTRALTVTASLNGYYKRKKNQLIRNVSLSRNQLKQAVTNPFDNSNTEWQRAPKMSFLNYSRSLSMRRFDKVLERACKPSKFSWVWTLGGTEDTNSLHHWKVLACLFPWKRTTYWRYFMSNALSVSNRSSFSPIRKLPCQLLQKTKRKESRKELLLELPIQRMGAVSLLGHVMALSCNQESAFSVLVQFGTKWIHLRGHF